MSELETLETSIQLTEEVQALQDEPGDGPDGFTHIIAVRRSRDELKAAAELTAQDLVDLARLNGKQISALCGHRWVPLRNPKNYPVCQICENLMKQIRRIEGA